jgi:hypothetical protein
MAPLWPFQDFPVFGGQDARSERPARWHEQPRGPRGMPDNPSWPLFLDRYNLMPSLAIRSFMSSQTSRLAAGFRNK